MKKTPVTLAKLLAVVICGLITAPAAFAASDTWSGASATSGNWSDPANWNTLPSSGDLLFFAGTTQLSNTNDFSGYTFDGITFNSGAGAFVLNGNSFTLSGGVTNNSSSATIVNTPMTLASNETVLDASGNITLGGVISDGGNGYGLSFPGLSSGGHTVTMTNVNTYGGPTIFGGNFGGANGAYAFDFNGQGSSPNSVFYQGVQGSGDATYYVSNPNVAGTVQRTAGFVYNGVSLGGNNYNNFTINGTTAGNVIENFGALTLNSGMLNGNIVTPSGDGNVQVLFSGVTRQPGTSFYFGRSDNNTSALGLNPIASQTAAQANIVFTTPPALVGNEGTVNTNTGTPDVSIVTWANAVAGISTYDSTYGLRGLAAGETTALVSGMVLNAGNGGANGQNATLGANTTLTASTVVNSLGCSGDTLNMSGTNTLTVTSGKIDAGVGPTLGASVNDGFIAFGPSEGQIYTENSRHTVINSVITGTGGVTFVFDDYNSTGTSCALYGTNTYSGITTVEGNNAGLSLLLYNKLALQNSTLNYNYYGAQVVLESGPGSFVFGGLEGAQNLAIPYPLTVGGDNDTSDTYSGVLSGAGSLTKTGTGAFTLTSANTYSGGTFLSSGQLNINNGGTSSANSAIGAAALTISGGTIDNTSGSAVTLLPNNAQNWNGSFTFNGSSSLNLGTGLVSLGGNEQVTINANTLTVGGVISGSGDSLTLAGNGTLALSGANTYSGNTIVSGGKLALTGSGEVSSPQIVVSNGATFDVSGLSSTFTLSGSQSLLGSGTNNGSISTSSGSQIYADDGVAYGTNTFNNNLTLASGAVANFQLGAAANGPNDLIAIGGNLTLNGNIVNISAPSASANLDTSDYTLFTVNGDISGSVAATPNWIVQPPNFGHYTIVTGGNTVKLHYSAIVNPVGSGSAVPNPAGRGANILVTVTVTTPGSAPVSTVTLNATPIGGASSVPLVEVGATASYTNTVTVGEVPAGSTPLAATITDTDGGSATVPISLTIQAAAETWNGGGSDNNMTDPANWAGLVSPLGGDAVTFAGTIRLTPVMDGSFTLSAITFDPTAGSFTLTNTPGSLLTLDGGGVTNNSASPQTLNVPIDMSTAQTFDVANGNLNIEGAISGASLAMAGNNVLVLSGTNTYGGGTMVNGGTIVVANNSALGSGTLTLSGGSISNAAGGSYSVPNSVALSTAANVGVGSGDTFALAGTISGGGDLAKIGNGALVLPNANNNSGGVTVNAGTLVVGNNSALGSGLLTLGNSSISNSAGSSYTVANAVSLSGAANVLVGTNDTFTLSGAITNTGSLALIGSGTVNLPGANANTYSGGTALDAGIVDIGNTSISPLGSGPLVLAGGTIEDAGSAAFTLSNNVIVVTNTTSYLNPTAFNGTGLTLAGNISGPGNIIVNGSGTIYDSFALSGTNTLFTGTFTVDNSSYQRFAFIGPAAGSPNAAFVLNAAGADAQKIILGTSETNTIAFGSLAGGGWIRNDSYPSLGIIRVGDLNTSTKFDGLFNQVSGTGTTGLLKVGSGTLTMTNGSASVGDYTGPTEVAAGQLLISVVDAASSPIQVDDGATLGVLNYTGLGLYASPSSITVGTNSGATLLFTNLDGSSPYGEIVTSDFTNNGTCTIVIPDTNNITVGNTYYLMLYGTYGSSGAGSFVLSSPYVQGYVTNDVPDGQLELVVTNIVSPPVINPNPAPIIFSASSGNLSLSWPPDHQGWYLQSQTNLLNTNWVDVAGSSSVTNEIIPINSGNPTEFYRLSLQP